MMDESVIYSQIDATEPILEYADFRTGLTYYDVYYMIWNRPHKRRNGVLGAWHQIKLRMYSRYVSLYEQVSNPEYIPF